MLRPEHIPLTLTSKSDGIWLPKFAAIVGWSEISRRAETLVKKISENPFLENLLIEKFYVEMWIYLHRQQQLARKKLPQIETNPDLFAAISFATMFAAIYDHLDVPARKKLRGQLLDGLHSGKGLLPLQHEIGTVVHLLQKGFSVTLSDLSTPAGGFDFLVHVGNIDVEVECKNFGPDTGRKITSEDLIAFGPKIRRLWPKFAPGQDKLRLVRLLVPDRLGRNNDEHVKHLSAIEGALKQIGSPDSALGSVNVSDFSVPSELVPRSNTIPSNSLFRTFLDQCIGRPNLSTLIVFDRARGFLAVAVISEKENSIIGSIEQALLDSAKDQLSGHRPAWIFVRLTGVSPDGMARFKEQEKVHGGNGLQRIATSLFARRPHVHSIIFVPGRMMLNERNSPIIGAKRVSQGSAPAYIFRNPEHALASDPRLKL